MFECAILHNIGLSYVIISHINYQTEAQDIVNAMVKRPKLFDVRRKCAER